MKNLELDEPRRTGRVRVVEAISVVGEKPHLGSTKTGWNRTVTLPGFLVGEMGEPTWNNSSQRRDWSLRDHRVDI